MRKFLLNLNLRNKILLSVSSALFALLMLGFSYYRTVSQLELNKVQILKSEDLSKNVLKMKFAMAHSLKLLMEIITTDSPDEVNMFWDEHQAIVKDYDANYKVLDSILKDPTFAQKYEDLKANFINSSSNINQFHGDRLKASIQKVYELRVKQLSGDSSKAIQKEIDALDDQLDADAEKVLADVNALVFDINVLSSVIQQDSEKMAASSKWQGVFLICLGIVLTLLAFYILIVYLISTISKLTDALQMLSEGKLPAKNPVASEDELGQITLSLNKLTEGLEMTSKFANEVGQGNFQMDFKPLSNDDVLGNALIGMRTNLLSVAQEDKKRAWATEGMARFGEILRNNTTDLETLANNIIANLVRYVGANQGGLFIVNDTNQKDKFLELKACYAWDKKKFIDKRVNVGEGLVGQAWQEGDLIYITEIPQDFVTITSGLGGANPRCLLIVPLTVNDETFGVIEIASFHLFEDYQMDFMRKLGESIASTLSGAKTNERTKYLLEQSQQQTEEMRAQEEEMRQNMEEMQATSEESERKSQNYESAIQRLNQEIKELTEENLRLKS